MNWVDKARKDWVSLEILVETKNSDTAETICFLAQAEDALFPHRQNSGF